MYSFKWDTIQKLTYRANAGIGLAQAELEYRLTEAEKKLLSRMNKAGLHAEITAGKAAGILRRSESTARAVLKGLAEKGYLRADTSKVPHVYQLQQHFVEELH